MNNKHSNSIKDYFTGIHWNKFSIIIVSFGFLIIAFASVLLVSTIINSIQIYGVLFGVIRSGFGIFAYLLTILFFVLLSFSSAKYEKFYVIRKSKRSGDFAQASGIFAEAKTNKKARVIAIITTVVMLLCATACFTYYGIMQTKKSKFTEIAATCVELKADPNSDNIYFSAVYQYEVNNVIYTYKSTSKSTNTGIYVGETKTIFYNPNNPKDVYLGETEVLVLGLGLFLIFCLGICIFGMFLKDSIIQNYLFVSFACLGLTFIIFIFMSGGNKYHNFFDFVHHFPEFQFVLIFGYAGVYMIFLSILHIIADIINKIKEKYKHSI